MQTYLDLLKDIKENGVKKKDRTGVGTISVFGRQVRFSLDETTYSDGKMLVKNFPAMTTKSLAWKSVVSELLWFMCGSTKERVLAKMRYPELSAEELKSKRTIWTDNYEKQGVELGYTPENGYSDNYLGPIYGHQWRSWDAYVDVNNKTEHKHIDQLADVINRISKNPWDRRLIVSAWNVGMLDKMALPPCHMMFQFNVRPGENPVNKYVDNAKYLDLMWTQRSVDTFLGLSFNIASYALLLCIVSEITGLIPGDVIGNLGDTHIYLNHLDAIEEQLKRTPHELPTLEMPEIGNLGNLEHFNVNDFKLLNYVHDEPIKAKMAV